MTNAEVHGAIALILMELEKINKHLDKLMQTGETIYTKETKHG